MSDSIDRDINLIGTAHDMGFEKGINAERERVKALFDAAKDLRVAVKNLNDSNYGGEIDYADAVHHPINLLLRALFEYEKECNQ